MGTAPACYWPMMPCSVGEVRAKAEGAPSRFDPLIV